MSNDISVSNARCGGKKFYIKAGGVVVSRAYLYICHDDEHSKPFGLLSGVLTNDGFEGKGYATQLVLQIIQSAKAAGCYKLIDTSRNERTNVHAWYLRLGFVEWGKEFRINF